MPPVPKNFFAPKGAGAKKRTLLATASFKEGSKEAATGITAPSLAGPKTATGSRGLTFIKESGRGIICDFGGIVQQAPLLAASLSAP